MVHVHVFKIDAEIQSDIRLQCSFATNWKASSENQKFSSQEHWLCTYLSYRNGAVLLADLPKACLGLS